MDNFKKASGLVVLFFTLVALSQCNFRDAVDNQFGKERRQQFEEGTGREIPNKGKQYPWDYPGQ